MGAFITLMASLTGFFAQQLVQFQDCLEEDTAALVNISRTSSYSRVGGFVQTNSPADYAPMVAAINVGILQSPGDLTSALSSGCGTGNCTFSEVGSPSFSTLAISHICEDITSQIHVVNETKPRKGDPYTRVYLGLDYGQNQTFAWSKERGGPVVSSWVAAPSNTSDLIALYFLFRPHWNNTDWKISKCSLFPTINTYEARIRNAVLEESLIGAVTLERIAFQFRKPRINDEDFGNLIFSWDHRMTTSYTIRNGVRESCEGSDTPTPGLTRFLKLSDDATYVNLTGHTNPSAGWKWWYFPKDCDWSVRKSSKTAMVDTLTEVFDKQEASMGYIGGVFGSAHLRVLFQDGNITVKSVDERIKGLATAMTTVIRTSAETIIGRDGNVLLEASENATGIVWNNTTCIYIRWSWVSFPSVMIGLTGLFLLLIAFDNREIETDRLWKSSFLAALFCEVEVPQKPAGKEEMKIMAKSTSVSLEDKRATLRFVSG
ncbi:hypothetical protein IQ06DRAFT_134391 [Phaeosphaeriaceae sp. SRC1lsM3a]|nr:hypothetical protein IQ06DRAFT_134391 [Stagonospora sp. SRC1lsM3a]